MIYHCSALEYKEAMLRIHFNDLADYVQSELHIMVTPYGRSIIYLITGLVLLTEGSWFQSILGIIILALGMNNFWPLFNIVDDPGAINYTLSQYFTLYFAGGFIFNSMRKSVDKLYKMKIQLASEGQLKTIFDKYASDSSGELDTTQVARLCVDLGAGSRNTIY